jgi:tetratricopeptide (TPR) repeat protein
MMKRAGRVATVAGLAVVLFVAGGIGLWRVGRSDPAAAPVPPSNGQAQALSAGTSLRPGTLTQIIASLQARLRAQPTDWRSYAQLGLAYVQQARVSADPTYYPKAQGVLQRSLQLSSTGNFSALTGLAALSAARHDFAGALRYGEQAKTVNPYNAVIRAVIGDALVELGRYPEAFAAIQVAVDLRPQLSTYARASYALELQGNVPAAIEAMKLARSSAGSAADGSWADFQLGELYWSSGQLDLAEAAYRDAERLDPTYVPPHAGLAKVEAATGQTDQAVQDLRWVVERYPMPEYVILLGDLFSATGQAQQAAQQFALVGVEQRLLQANGVNVDLEIALFDADHRTNLVQGLTSAQAEWARRHSVHVADALAWELFANGRAAEALPYANQALHLGTKNALFLFHRGMIEKALGQTEGARKDLAAALDVNPHFSILFADQASEALASLGGRP